MSIVLHLSVAALFFIAFTWVGKETLQNFLVKHKLHNGKGVFLLLALYVVLAFAFADLIRAAAGQPSSGSYHHVLPLIHAVNYVIALRVFGLYGKLAKRMKLTS